MLEVGGALRTETIGGPEMNDMREPYEATFTCAACARPVAIRVEWPLKATLVIDHWRHELGGLCAACWPRRPKEEVTLP